MNNKNRSRLELGENWWSRLLQLLFWLVIIGSFLAVVSRDGVTEVSFFLGLAGAGIWAFILFALWRLLQWIVNGSVSPKKVVEKKSEKQGPPKANSLPFIATLLVFAVFFVMFLISTFINSPQSFSTYNENETKRILPNSVNLEIENDASQKNSSLIDFKYVYRDPKTLFCPSNVKQINGGQYCECADGFIGNVPRTECIRLPLNAHGVNSQRDAWVCNDGFEEIENSCEFLIKSVAYSTTALEVFDTLFQEWNTSSWEIVTPYLDPTVTSEEWVQTASKWMPELRFVHSKMKASLATISPSREKDTLQKIVNSYEQKIEALTTLHFAVNEGDTKKEQQAGLRLSQLGQEAESLALEFMKY